MPSPAGVCTKMASPVWACSIVQFSITIALVNALPLVWPPMAQKILAAVDTASVDGDVP